MARFKQIMYFVFIIVVFAIFSNFMMKVGLKNTYKTITGKINAENVQITVAEAKTTEVNGYLKGTIKNDSKNDIEKIFIKLDVYSKRDTNLGTEYLEISNLKAGESRDFEIKYKYHNVAYYEITCVEEKE